MPLLGVSYQHARCPIRMAGSPCWLSRACSCLVRRWSTDKAGNSMIMRPAVGRNRFERACYADVVMEVISYGGRACIGNEAVLGSCFRSRWRLSSSFSAGCRLAVPSVKATAAIQQASTTAPETHTMPSWRNRNTFWRFSCFLAVTSRLFVRLHGLQ